MHAALSKWSQLANGNALLGFIDVTLRGCAQVMFQNNPLTGLLFFAAIFVGAFAEGNPAVAFGSVLGTVAATFTGMHLKDQTSWKAGLFGYNGCLVGVGLPTFLEVTPVVWLCIILGGVVSVIVTICIADILKTWKVAALTAPFVLVTWTMLLASYAFGGLNSHALPLPNLPHDLVAHTPDLLNGIDVFVVGSAVWAGGFITGGAGGNPVAGRAVGHQQRLVCVQCRAHRHRAGLNLQQAALAGTDLHADRCNFHCICAGCFEYCVGPCGHPDPDHAFCARVMVISGAEQGRYALSSSISAVF
jgi:hypothetical protein